MEALGLIEHQAKTRQCLQVFLADRFLSQRMSFLSKSLLPFGVTAQFITGIDQ